MDRVLDFVGVHHLKLGAKVDALVFSDGVGERSRQRMSSVSAVRPGEECQHFGDKGNVGDIGMGGTTKQTNRYGCYTPLRHEN